MFEFGASKGEAGEAAAAAAGPAASLISSNRLANGRGRLLLSTPAPHLLLREDAACACARRAEEQRQAQAAGKHGDQMTGERERNVKW